MAPIFGNLLIWLWLAMAALLVRLTRGQRRCRARRSALALLGILWLLACRPVAELFVRPLESRYAPPSLASLAKGEFRQVVVLAAGGWSTRGELAGSTLPDSSAQRFLGGLEVCALLRPDCRLIFSGSAGRGIPSARMMQQLVQRVDPEMQVLSESNSERTADHPRNVRPLLDADRFLLVTSAYHMPRAMRSFRRAGLHPTAYPVDFMVRGGYHWDAWLPTLGSADKLGTVWREYLALTFYVLCGI